MKSIDYVDLGFRKEVVNIIDLNQKVTIKWFTRNVQKYKELGYTYTKIGDEFDISLSDLNKDSNYHVIVTCDCCGKETSTPYRNYNKIIAKNGIYRCLSCRSINNNNVRKNSRTNEYYNKFLIACKEHGYKPITTIDEMDGCETNVKFICPKHGEQTINLWNLTHGNGCRKCADYHVGERRRFTPDKVQEIVNSKNNNELINPSEYIDCNTKNLIIKCGSCNKLFVSNLTSIMNGGGRCQICGRKRLSDLLKYTSDDIDEMLSHNSELQIINTDEYVSTTKRNMLVRCTQCGKIYKSNINDYINKSLTRCKHCVSKISYGEYYLYNLFEDMGLRFEYQKRFKDCKDKKTLPFDFYLTDYNMCIEFDGIQHFRPVRGIDNFNKTKLHDSIKDEYCKSHNIRLLRIPSSDYEKMSETIISILKST